MNRYGIKGLKMNYSEFLNFKEQPCRFRLKSGKEVYGVVWEKNSNGRIEYLFASSRVHQLYKSTATSDLILKSENMIFRISLDEVIYAEPLETRGNS